MKLYKFHYACFDCRKTFKRKLIQDINGQCYIGGDKLTVQAKCPQCGQLMTDMGKNFKAPKMDNIKEWTYIKTMYSVGLTFASIAIRVGGEPVPNSIKKLKDHLEKMKLRSQTYLSITKKETGATVDRGIMSHMTHSAEIKDIEQKLDRLK